MTANQIAYWKNVETERANRANEAIASQKNYIAQQEADTNKRKAKADERRAAVSEREVGVKEYLAESQMARNASGIVSDIAGAAGNFMKGMGSIASLFS